MQHGGLRRQVDVGHVSVPDRFAVAEIADRFVVVDHVRNHVEFGVLLEKRLAVWIWSGRIEFSKVLAERDELRVGKLLVMEDHNKSLAPGVFDRLYVATGQWL